MRLVSDMRALAYWPCQWTLEHVSYLAWEGPKSGLKVVPFEVTFGTCFGHF